MKTERIPFHTTDWKASDKVIWVAPDGHEFPFRVLCIDARGKDCVAGLLHEGPVDAICQMPANGSYFGHQYLYIEREI